MTIKLSILIPTLPNRLELFYLPLMKILLKQIDSYNNIELISLFDNKKRTIGRKRQNMIDVIQGEYVCFIDDDDRISDDYIKLIMDTLDNNPNTDCVVFWSCINQPNMEDKIVKFGFEEGNNLPCHVHVWKSSIVKKYEYKNINHGEDNDWINRAKNDIHHLSKIDKILYYYDARYNTTSETVGLSEEIIKKNINEILYNTPSETVGSSAEIIKKDINTPSETVGSSAEIRKKNINKILYNTPSETVGSSAEIRKKNIINFEIIIDNDMNLFDIQNEIIETNKKIYIKIDKKSFNNNLKEINTFYKCMKKGYCYKDSSKKIPIKPNIKFF